MQNFDDRAPTRNEMGLPDGDMSDRPSGLFRRLGGGTHAEA
jgi:hypothetical protein